MRFTVLLMLLVGLSVPAVAQTEGRLSLERPGAAALGLRGAGVSQASPAAGEASAGPVETTPAPALGLRPMAGSAILSRPTPPDAQACRMACAQSYYFCLAGDGTDECPQAWGQCRLGCGPGAG